jgi:hypothetical protein
MSNFFRVRIDAPQPPAGEIPNSKFQITNKEVLFGHIINASGDITCTCNLKIDALFDKAIPLR